MKMKNISQRTFLYGKASDMKGRFVVQPQLKPGECVDIVPDVNEDQLERLYKMHPDSFSFLENDAKAGGEFPRAEKKKKGKADAKPADSDASENKDQPSPPAA